MFGNGYLSKCFLPIGPNHEKKPNNLSELSNFLTKITKHLLFSGKISYNILISQTNFIYHARFLTPLARIKLPFFGRSIYDSALRADMTVGDTEFEGPAAFYKDDFKIVKRQYELHRKVRLWLNIMNN